MPGRKNTSDSRRTQSYLVRFWHEPGGPAESEPTIRGFVRNLRTGAERAIRDPHDLVELIHGELAIEKTAREAKPRAKAAARSNTA